MEAAKGIGIDSEMLLLESKDVKPVLNRSYELSSSIMIICRRGWMRFRYNMQETMIQRNDLMVLLPDSQVMFSEVSADYDATTIILSNRFGAGQSQANSLKLQIRFVQNPVVSLTERESGIMQSFFEQMKYIAGSQMTNKEETVRMLFDVMFSVFMSFKSVSQYPGESNSHTRQIFERFIVLVIAHHREAREVIWYADKMCMTPKYLASIVKQTTKLSANYWINQYVILDAKHMLKTEKQWSILEIAERLGFVDLTVFSRYFKKHVGVPPSAYREV